MFQTTNQMMPQPSSVTVGPPTAVLFVGWITPSNYGKTKTAINPNVKLHFLFAN